MESLDRRRFLQTTGLAAAGLTLLKASPASSAANGSVGCAVIGFNSRGSEHIGQILAMKNATLVALCDVDQKVLDRGVAAVEKKTGTRPTPYTDMRKLFEDKAVDAIFIATPNHWHALATIWGCQAGKDVYVEKPACWSFAEGETMVAAARKYGRMVQVGHDHTRASGGARTAVGHAWAGHLGQTYLSRGLCYKPRTSLGHKPDGTAPANLDWELWQGPAKRRPFSERFVHYNWHWFWDYGNGDIGNQGVHQMDQARWFLNRAYPTLVNSAGGRYGYKDDGETPNTQFSTYHWPDGVELEFEVRGLPTNKEAGELIGNLLFGTAGWVSSGDGYKLHGANGLLMPDMAKALPPVGGVGGNNFQNFIDCVISRKRENLNCEVAEGVLSAQLVHLANIAYRRGHTLTFDPAKKRFVGDEAANELLARHDSPAAFTVPAPDKV